MSSFLAKYGTGTGADVIIPIIKRGVVDYSVSADWTPAGGDVKVSKDGGAAANITTLPTFLASIGWVFIFSDAELQCKKLRVVIVDSATKAIEDQFFDVLTFGHASAFFAADLSLANLPANVTQWLGAAVSTPTVAGVPNVNAKTWNDLSTVALPLIPTTPGRTLDVSATGEAGVDWANVGSPTATVNLPNTTLGTVTDVAAALANKLADVILRRTRTSVQASANGEAVDVSSLYGFLGQAQKSSRVGAALTVKNADGTTLGTLTLTQDADANPITGVN